MKENRNFKYFETTADIGIEIQTENMTDAYINAALATLNIITDIEKIKPKITKKIYVESEDEYGLLYDWITELLILLDSENFIVSKYNIKISKYENTIVIDGQILGDIYDRNIYNYKTEVKAITYHQMKITNEDNIYNIQFIVDL